MNELIVPPSGNWYESSSFVCASDNTLVYTSRNSIVIIKDTPPEIPAEVKIIPDAHYQKILSVNINLNWGKPNKYAVTASEDKIVKLWNLDNYTRISAHNEHCAFDNVVGAVFGGEERVISVSESGIVVVWNILTNTKNVIKNLFNKSVISCISSCPHAGWLVAFGLKSGLVIVGDLRRNGKILYKLRGHEKTVTGLSWCPAPVNIFPIEPRNSVKNKSVLHEKKSEVQSSKTDELHKNMTGSSETLETKLDKTEVPELTKKREPNWKKNNPWVNLKHADDDEIAEEEAKKAEKDTNQADSTNPEEEVEEDDFLKQCLMLKQKILDKKEDSSSSSIQAENIDSTDEAPLERPILKANRKQKASDADDKVEENAEDIVESKEVIVKQLADSSTSSQIDIPSTEVPERVIIKEEPEEEEPRKEFLLASCGRDNLICIWRAGTDGRMQTFVNHSKNRNQKHYSPKTWSSLCWAAPDTLLTSTNKDEIIKWTLPKRQDEKDYKLIHSDHKSLIFSIAAPMRLWEATCWKNQNNSNIWSFSQDRRLLNTSLSPERTCLNSYLTLGSSITEIAASPLDPNKIALAAGEAIYIWDLSRPQIKQIIMSRYYTKIQSKLTSLVWHPKNETVLAFGTLEGRIGLFDSSNVSKIPTIFKQYFRNEIYKLEIAPMPDTKEKYGLFALAEGKLVIFDMKHPDKDPLFVEMPDNTFAYNFAWKPDFKSMLLSTKTGALIVYSSQLKIEKIFYLQKKFHKIIWHPEAIHSSPELSEYCNYFAAVGNKEFAIYDATWEQEQMIATTSIKFNELINCGLWNPFSPNQFGCAGQEGILNIWDIKTNSLIKTYHDDNFPGIVSAMWSPSSENYIIVGDKLNCLKIVDISKAAIQKDIHNLRIETLKKITSETNYLLVKPAVPKEEKPKVKKASNNSLLPSFNSLQESSQLKNLKDLLRWKESKEDVTNIFKNIEDEGDSTMLNLVNLNQRLLKERGKFKLSYMLSLFKGDMNQAVKEAIETKTVSPWVISVAPMVSHQLWQQACEVYAEQLLAESDSDPLEIVSYLLACHKVEQAVDTLCERSLFKEALALAKCRVLEKSIVLTVLEKWAKCSVYNGDFETAAQCYISLEKYEDAASVLYRRSHVETLEVALQLAEKSENEELKKAIYQRFIAFKNEKDSEDLNKDMENKLSLAEDQSNVLEG